MPAAYKYNGRLWIESDGEPVLGPGRVELMERIQETGSIRQAAAQMEMSYRQAWQMIDHMNSKFPKPVMIARRGGKGGGSAEITEYGRNIIREFKIFHKNFHEFLAKNSTGIKL